MGWETETPHLSSAGKSLVAAKGFGALVSGWFTKYATKKAGGTVSIA